MNKNSWQKIALILGGLIVIFFISFHYAFLTNFPIGHDAGYHVSSAIKIESSGFFNFKALKGLYPVPLAIFAFFHKISQIAWPQLFLYTICLFLFLTASAWTYFTTKITDNWKIGIMSGVFLASSRWLSDAMRIGFFAEAWGWFVFIVCSYFLIKRKFWPLIICSILLFFSHPLVLAVFLLTLVLYTLVVLFSGPDKEDKLFLAKIFSVLLIIGVGILIFYPYWLDKFSYLSKFVYTEGARNLKEIIIDSDKRRILMYLVGIVGIIKSVQFLKSRGMKYLFVLLFVSVILSQLYLWGVEFMVFRFYPYLEMAISFFAAIGLYYLVDLVFQTFQKKWKIYLKPVFLSIFVLFLIWPNIMVNKSTTLWQKTHYELLAFCPPQDQEAFLWIKDNTPEESFFTTPVKWGAWLEPLAKRKVIEIKKIFTLDQSPAQVARLIKKYKINYIYFSSIQDKLPAIEDVSDFKLVYEKEGVRIYQVRQNAE